jgi:hypothetical protein
LGFEPALEEPGSKRRSVQDARSANIGVQTFTAQHLAVSDLRVYFSIWRWVIREYKETSVGGGGESMPIDKHLVVSDFLCIEKHLAVSALQ